MTIGLFRIDGPECPSCGCAHAELVRVSKTWGGKRQRRLRCEHCGMEWFSRIEEEPRPVQEPAKAPEDSLSDGRGVVFQVVRCPRCDSKDTRIYNSQSPIRYHKCNVCSHNFKSVEA